MSFFKSIGNAIGKVGKTIGSVTGKVLKTAAPVAAIIPGVGVAVSAAASVLGGVLDPPKQEKIEQAVANQGVVKVDKIESTILKDNPNIDPSTLQAATTAMVNQALTTTPTAKVDDSLSLTNVSMGTKIVQWVKSNAVLVLAGIGGLFFYMSNKKGGSSRRYRRY